ncbi:MAG: hypothetical protein KAG66_05545, partial [Methylococcales bacterium]|nr:hypothetical protein [Methylococcales bacterium]
LSLRPGDEHPFQTLHETVNQSMEAVMERVFKRADELTRHANKDMRTQGYELLIKLQKQYGKNALDDSKTRFDIIKRINAKPDVRTKMNAAMMDRGFTADGVNSPALTRPQIRAAIAMRLQEKSAVQRQRDADQLQLLKNQEKVPSEPGLSYPSETTQVQQQPTATPVRPPPSEQPGTANATQETPAEPTKTDGDYEASMQAVEGVSPIRKAGRTLEKDEKRRKQTILKDKRRQAKGKESDATYTEQAQRAVDDHDSVREIRGRVAQAIADDAATINTKMKRAESIGFLGKLGARIEGPARKLQNASAKAFQVLGHVLGDDSVGDGVAQHGRINIARIARLNV